MSPEVRGRLFLNDSGVKVQFKTEMELFYEKKDCIRRFGRLTLLLIAAFGLVVWQRKGAGAPEMPTVPSIIVLGGDRSFSDAYRHPVPVIFYQYNITAPGEGAYAQFTLLTTSVAAIIGYKTEWFLFGIRPVLAHSVYGGYTYYDRGVLDEGRIYQGNYTGVEGLCTFTPSQYFTATASYLPAWYFYRKNSESDNLISENDATTIGLPDNHFEHVGTFLMQLAAWRHRAWAASSTARWRSSATGIPEGSDTAPSRTSTRSHPSVDAEILRNLGLYLRLPYDFTILLDGRFISAPCRPQQRRDDRKQRCRARHHAGYFYGEFLSDRYAIGKRADRDPLVSGTRASSRDSMCSTCRGKTASSAVSAGTAIPAGYTGAYRRFQPETRRPSAVLLLSYAYGIDAQRNNAHEGTENKGSHEVLMYVLMAF
jgi:hypothetical protein